MNNDEKKSIVTNIRITPTTAAQIAYLRDLTHMTQTQIITDAIQAYYETAKAKAGADTPGQDRPADKIAEAVAAVEGRTPTPTAPTTPTAGATETPPETQQESQPDYISKAENATERAGEDQPEQVRIYTEAELKQAIQEAAQQAATQAARQARQEIKREMRSQAIQATGKAIEAARRAKASTVSTVNGLKPLRIRRGKK